MFGKILLDIVLMPVKLTPRIYRHSNHNFQYHVFDISHYLLITSDRSEDNDKLR